MELHVCRDKKGQLRMVASACVVDKGDGAMANQRFEIVKSRSDKREYRGLILPNRYGR